MTILASQIGVFKARNNNDASNNGGRSTTTKLAPSSKNSIFGDLENSGNIGGDIETRKVFIKPDLESLTNSAFANAYVYLRDIGDDDLDYAMGYGSASDTMSAATFDIMAGRVTSALVSSARIATPTPKTGSFDLVRYRPSTNSTVILTNATLTQETANTAQLTGVDFSLIETGDIITERVYFNSRDNTDDQNLKPRVFGVSVTSGGDFDESFISFSPKAALSVDVLIDFTNSVAFAWSIPSLGLSGTGDINTDLTVYHPDSPTQNDASTILKIESGAFSGSWSATSSINLSIESGAIAVWFRRIVDNSPNISGAQSFNFGLEYATS
ncbi:hypothetical protein [Vibrio phage vB_VhaS-a]|nr:hypothetical protein [Vibrio phage vB_VhaS-a]